METLSFLESWSGVRDYGDHTAPVGQEHKIVHL